MKYIDLIADFGDCKNLEEIRCAVEKIVLQMDYKNFLFGIEHYRSAGGSHRKIISSYPPAWLAIYEQRHYLDVDPVVRHMRTSHVPLIWETSMYRDPRQKEMMEEVNLWGLTDGLSMPLHTIDRKVGVLSLVGGDGHKPGSQVSLEEIGCAQLLVSFIHEAMERIAKAQALEEADDAVTLTPRERDCLQWSSIGKTSWEIGKILSISERTVNFHIYNAALKLHTYGRRHTAIKAILLGLIHP
jgi:LuxR family quorum-sensing transcriptional regulator LasR